MNKKTILGIVALVLVVALLGGLYYVNRPQTSSGSKAFTLVVVHSDGTEKTFDLNTDREFLGDALRDEKLIEGVDGMILICDGEEASWEKDNAYWAFYLGEEYATAGADTTPVNGGEFFKLVYTLG